MTMSCISGFDWDDANSAKCCKHGVSHGEIEEVLSGEPGIFPDPAHSQDEARFIAIGTTVLGRYVFVAFTIRTATDGDRLIRPISARYMHAKEVRHYERQQRKP